MNHLSFSKFKQFEECEAAAAAGWKTAESQALLEGKFFENYVTGMAKEFCDGHPELYKKSSNDPVLKKPFADAIDAANKLLDVPVINDIIKNCAIQFPVDGEIAGVPFIGFIDLYDGENKRCYDLKYVRQFGKLYSPIEYQRIEWYFAYRYHYQAAIYRELTGCDQYIIAATKEDHADIAYLKFADNVLDDAIDIVEHYAPRYFAILNGEIEPRRCEHCAYCRSTRDISKPEIIDEFK